MSAHLQPDLEQVKTLFESFRAGRVGKERLPENLWGHAIALLDQYPFRVVCRELRLKPDYLRQRAAAAKGNPARPVKKKPKFLTLTGRQLTAIKNGARKNVTDNSTPTECRIVIERTDGSRLTLNLPADWSSLEALCASFLRA